MPADSHSYPYGSIAFIALQQFQKTSQHIAPEGMSFYLHNNTTLSPDTFPSLVEQEHLQPKQIGILLTTLRSPGLSLL